MLRIHRHVKKIFILLLFGMLALVHFQMMSADFTSMWMKNVNTTWPTPTTPAVTKSTTVAQILAKCPQISQNITKHIEIDVERLNSTDYEDIKYVKPGGRYKPLDCESKHRVAVIVPYRDRENHLKIFLRYIHPFLQRQRLNYRIFVVEQTQDEKFNKAVMMNTGFVEANKLYNYTCFIFHDVDLLPENGGIPYNCDRSPVHLSVAIDTRKYKLPYKSSFGGVTAFRTEHFKKVNGFSNLYFEWGGEDDDMYSRTTSSHLKVTHLSQQLGRYKNLIHRHAETNPKYGLLFKTMKARYKSDGLNSLKSHVVQQEYRRLYTWILVSVNETDILNSEPIHKKVVKKPKVFKKPKPK